MLAVALALGSSLSWGFADFLGGLKSRQLALLTVVLVSQAAGLAITIGVVVARGQGPPGGGFALFAALAGTAGIIGLTAFYRGMAVGTMSVIAPISATAALVPVAFGLATGDRPSLAQGAGVVLAMIGVVLAAREPGRAVTGGTRVARGAGFALVAALGFGTFFVALDAASTADPYWAILVQRLTAVSIAAVAAVLAGSGLALTLADARALIAVGVFDVTANTLFAVASTLGLLSLVGVLSSLYPLVTVLLARLVLSERIDRLQKAGVAGALAGVALISGG